MNKALRYLLLLACVIPPLLHAAEPIEVTIENLSPDSEIQHDNATDTWRGLNGVMVKYPKHEIVLTAETITYSESTGEIQAEGNVRLKRERQTWVGDRLSYNLRTREMKSDYFRAGMTPFFVTGFGLAGGQTNGVYSATDGTVTTDDSNQPFFRIRAHELKVTTGKKIEARGATVFLGKVPVMYFPYYHRSLERHPNNIALTPGYRSLYGAYLLGTYNWYLNTNLDGAVHLDYRTRRGVGTGPEFNYNAGRFGKGAASYYYTRDDRPGTDLFTGKPIPSDRQAVDFIHQAEIITNLTAKIVVHHQTDPNVLRDFFEWEYRSNPQPKSFLEINQAWPNWTLDVLAQPQLNTFFETVERLPDVKLSGLRQQIGSSPLFYESETSAAYLRFRSASHTGTNYSASRGDTFHQILLPKTFFGWLNITPRVGGRFTYYGETDGLGPAFENEQNRAVFNTGAEASFKASRVLTDAKNRLFDVDGIRHIVEPSLNYVFIPRPNVTPNEIPQFDRELPTLRLLPIDFPDYNSIDAIDSQSTLRLGVRNKLQTKRKGEVDNLVNWAVYTDWRMDPRPGQGTFADLFSDLDLKPRSWLYLNSELRYNLNDRNVRAANHSASIMPNDRWSVGLGHRYFREDPIFGPNSGNNLIFTRLYYKLNENWALRISHHFEARDGTLEEQYYTVYRDFRSWTGALTFRMRDNRTGPSDYAIAVTFSLKAFPRFSPNSDREMPSLLLGG